MPINLQKSTATTALSMTPLIDVVFLLLIFFLVATRFEEEERDLDVHLPQASEAQPSIASQENMFVSLMPDGAFFLAGKRVELSDLEEALQDAYLRNPGKQRVVIRSDVKSDVQQLISALNACNKANIQNYSIAIE